MQHKCLDISLSNLQPPDMDLDPNIGHGEAISAVSCAWCKEGLV